MEDITDRSKSDDEDGFSMARSFPDGTSCRTVSFRAVEYLRQTRFGGDGRRAEIFFLSQRIIPERYLRNMKTFTVEDQIRMLESHVCIVGMGGLGCAVVEILARLGVGALTLIDGDQFEESNLNRQILATPQRIGLSKTKAAQIRIQEINPSLHVQEHAVYLNADNARQFIKSADVVVDCLDNLKTRFILEKAAKAAVIPLVSAAIAGSFGQITVVFPEDPGLERIYGPEHQTPVKGAETSLGALPHTAMLLASLECSEVVKILLKRGVLLRNQLLVVDLMSNSIETFSV